MHNIDKGGLEGGAGPTPAPPELLEGWGGKGGAPP